MEKLIRRLEACNHALKYAAWNYSEMKLKDLELNIIESTGVAESCLIEVRNNNLTIEELQLSQKAVTGESNCNIDSVMPRISHFIDENGNNVDLNAEGINVKLKIDGTHEYYRSFGFAGRKKLTPVYGA